MGDFLEGPSRLSAIIPRIRFRCALHGGRKIRFKAAIVVGVAFLAGPVCGQPMPPAPLKKQPNLMELARALRDNPPMQQRFRDQQFQELKDVFGEFVKEAGLSAEQTKKFYQILLDDAVEAFIQDAEEMDNVTALTALAPEGTPNRGAELERQLRLLFGDRNFKRLEQYRKTESERLFLAQYRHELRMGDIALPDDAAKALFEIVCDERARTPPLPFDPRTKNGDMRKALEGDNAERYYESEADLSRRILSRAGSALNAEQYEALAKFQDRHLAAEKAGIEAMRSMIQQSQQKSDE